MCAYAFLAGIFFLKIDLSRRRCNFNGGAVSVSLFRQGTFLFDTYNPTYRFFSFFFRNAIDIAFTQTLSLTISCFCLFQVSAISSTRSTVRRMESTREYVALMKFRNAVIASKWWTLHPDSRRRWKTRVALADAKRTAKREWRVQETRVQIGRQNDESSRRLYAKFN